MSVHFQGAHQVFKFICKMSGVVKRNISIPLPDVPLKCATLNFNIKWLYLYVFFYIFTIYVNPTIGKGIATKIPLKFLVHEVFISVSVFIYWRYNLSCRVTGTTVKIPLKFSVHKVIISVTLFYKFILCIQYLYNRHCWGLKYIHQAMRHILTIIINKIY